MRLAPAVFLLPGLGLMLMVGPIVSILVGSLEGTVVVGGVAAPGTALGQIGMSENKVVKCETALAVDKYVLMVHSRESYADAVRSILAHAKPMEVV